jgi:hypothetical protein
VNYYLDEAAKEFEAAKRAYDSLERQMDQLIYENRDLRDRLTEAELEIKRLTDELALAHRLGGAS